MICIIRNWKFLVILGGIRVIACSLLTISLLRCSELIQYFQRATSLCGMVSPEASVWSNIFWSFWLLVITAKDSAFSVLVFRFVPTQQPAVRVERWVPSVTVFWTNLFLQLILYLRDLVKVSHLRWWGHFQICLSINKVPPFGPQVPIA